MLQRRHKNSRRHAGLREHPAHLKWIRGFACAACGHRGSPDNRIEAAQVDYAGIGPERKMTGGKVPDWKVIPLCSLCHSDQHRVGWKQFEIKSGLRAEAKADELAAMSPRAQEMREARQQLMEQR
jgi:hypothetical protein